MTAAEPFPGCFATGREMNELREALDKAVSVYLSEPGHPMHVQLAASEEQAGIHAGC